MEEIIYKIYQWIGDYFTGKRKQFCIFAFFIFTVLTVVSIRYEIKVPLDTLYLVFSSIVQSLLALVALLGVMIVFKLEAIKSREERILDDKILRKDIMYFRGPVSPIGSPKELVSIIDEILKKSSRSSAKAGIRRLKETQLKIVDFYKEKTFLKGFMLKLGVYALVVVSITLILLAFTHIIHQYNLSLPILYLIILFTIYTLFLTIKGISAAL